MHIPIEGHTRSAVLRSVRFCPLDRHIHRTSSCVGGSSTHHHCLIRTHTDRESPRSLVQFCCFCALLYIYSLNRLVYLSQYILKVVLIYMSITIHNTLIIWMHIYSIRGKCTQKPGQGKYLLHDHSYTIYNRYL